MHTADIREHDPDPGLHRRRVRRLCRLTAFRQHRVRPVQIPGLAQHRAEQPQKVRPQALIVRALRERAFQPAAAFLQQPAAEPEVSECPGQLRPGRVAVCQGPVQRGAEIVLLPRQHSQPALSPGQAHERGRVPPPGCVSAASLGEPGRRVIADRVQQPVPGPVLARLGDHQRLAGQPVDHLQTGQLIPAAAHLSRLRQPEGASEHRQLPQEAS